MSGPAPKEIQGRPTGEDTKIVHLPTQEANWRGQVVKHVQEAGPSFTTQEATPHATQPIPSSQALEGIGAERVGAEPVIDTADITDIMGKTAGHVVGLASDEGLLTHEETVPGKKAVLSMRKRASLLEEEGKAA